MATTQLSDHTNLVTRATEEIHFVFVLDSLRNQFIHCDFPSIYRGICEDIGLPPITTCSDCFEAYMENTCEFVDINAMDSLIEDDPINFPPDTESWTEEQQESAQDWLTDGFIDDHHSFCIDFHNTCQFFHMAYRERIGWTSDYEPVCRWVNIAVVGVW
jgi:hypothetical protein